MVGIDVGARIATAAAPTTTTTVTRRVTIPVAFLALKLRPRFLLLLPLGWLLLV